MSAAEADRLARQAAGHHRAGRAAEAERFYQAALLLLPGHADSLHGLGCLAHAAGRTELAIGLIGQAVAAAPLVAHYTLSLGLALLDRGHVEEARAALHVAVLRDTQDPRAHRALAQALSRLGRLDEAEASLRTAIRLAPADAAGPMSLGGVLRGRGELQAALAAFAEAARLAPNDPLAWHALASACGSLGELARAEAAFRQVARLLPDDAAAQANLGTALFGLDRLEEARECLLRSQALAPRNAATLSSLGLVLMGLGDTAAAERMLAHACREAPESDAIAVNHGTALAALERHGEAEAVFRAVLARDASQVQARFNLGTQLLGRGALAEGWAAFEARLSLIARTTTPALPEWDGSAVQAGRVLIRAEQGLGDSLQFLRWIAPAALRARLLLELPPPLHRLVRQAGLFDPERVRLLAPGEAPDGDAVAQVSLLSLPHRLAHPMPPPMTLAAAALSGAQAGRTQDGAPQGGGLRVGLAWAGSASYRFDRQRSIRLEQLAPLVAVAGVSFVSLQHGPAASQPAPAGMRLAEAVAGNLADTAAAILSLDLVISVDTMIAHLAGALGRPVWLLDRFGGDWRWREGFASGRTWYPTLRRFAQPQPGAWDAAIGRAADALAVLAQTGGGKPERI